MNYEIDQAERILAAYENKTAGRTLHELSQARQLVADLPDTAPIKSRIGSLIVKHHLDSSRQYGIHHIHHMR